MLREGHLPWDAVPELGTEIDWGCSDAQGLDVVITGSHVFRNGTASPLVIAAGSPTILPGALGVGPTFPNYAGHRFTGGTVATVGANEGFTLEVLGAFTATPILSGMFGVENGFARALIANGGGSFRNICFWTNESNTYAGVDWRQDGSIQHVFCVSDGGSGTPLRFYRDGQLIATATTPASSAVATPTVRVGDMNQGWSATPTGTIYRGSYFRRPLSAQEIAARTRNPWPEWRPRLIDEPGATAAAAAIGASSSVALSVAASGAATVTVQASATATLQVAAAGSATVVEQASSVALLSLTGAGAANAATQASSSSTFQVAAVSLTGVGVQANSSAMLAVAAAASATLIDAITASSTISLSLTANASATLADQVTSSSTLAVAANAATAVQVQAASAASLQVTATGTATNVAGNAATSAAILQVAAAGALQVTETASSSATLQVSGAAAAQAMVAANSAAALAMAASGTAMLSAAQIVAQSVGQIFVSASGAAAARVQASSSVTLYILASAEPAPPAPGPYWIGPGHEIRALPRVLEIAA